MPPEQRALGRWNWRDERDLPLAGVYAPGQGLPESENRWGHGPILDQGQLPQCVAYGWKQFLQSVPVEQGFQVAPQEIYDWAQRHDEWPGEHYDGTSVRAGAKWAQQAGYLSEYRWATTLQEMLWWLRDKGPIVLGTAWFEGMSNLRSDYVALPEGRLLGGHCYLAIGYEPSWQAVVCVNSWGPDWGQDGVFYLWQTHLEWLVQNHGEACVAIERDGNTT